MKKLFICMIFLFLAVLILLPFKNIFTAKQFILKYGWIIDKKSVIIEEVKIPNDFKDSIKDYEKMLNESGFHIDFLKGKTVKKYSYKIENHIEKNAFANVFVYKGRIVFADITIPRIDGYIHNINERKYQNAS